MAGDGSQQRKPGFKTAVEDVKTLATLLAKEAQDILGRRTAQVLGVLGIFVVVGSVLLVVLLILYGIGRLFDITLLNLLKVLAVPITVGAAVPLLNWLQKKRELDVENQRAQDEALQAYLDQISQLLTDKDRPLNRAQPSDPLSTVARARTLTVLWRLNGSRKGSLVQFLYEAGLIDKNRPIVAMGGADLSDANLIEADLSRATLSVANLIEANLARANLSRANLSGTNLMYATLSGADLSGADLSGADLNEAIGLTDAQIAAAESLDNATMPNGQKYEDWLKNREGRKEDAEND
jgi:tetrahydromethanopterin S-methyltransferase subunit F